MVSSQQHQMRVAVAYEKFGTSQSGGARESLLTLLDGLADRRELVVDAYQTPPVDDPPKTSYDYSIHTKRLRDVPKFTWASQVVARMQWQRYFSKQLDSNCDLLLTQNRLAPAAVDIAGTVGIPSLFFVRSLSLTGYEKYDPTVGHVANLARTDVGGRVQYPFLVRNFREYLCAIRSATGTIANSEHTASRIRALFGTEADVVYPPITLEDYDVSYDADGSIMMVNPRAEYKGADIFLDIADAMPDERFRLVGPIGSVSIKDRVAAAPNVNHTEWCRDMRTAYRDAKLVVVPSRWEEPFGRVPAEAMVSGIPCVVSDRGGLPEVVGDTGLVVSDLESVDTWVAAIHQALDMHDPDAQRDRVERFSTDRQIAKLDEVIDAL